MGRHTRAAAAVPALVLTVMLAGCAQPADSTTAAGPSAPAVSPAAAATSAPPDAPSKQAALVCSAEAREDIAELIGVDATEVGPLGYANHVSTCRYAYPNGSFMLVVQDLPDDMTTTRAFEGLAAQRGKVDTIDLPDADAFSTTDGSVVLRKDTKVMLVDVTGLPAMFGSPPVARADSARLIMKAVLGCWTELS